MVAQSAIDWVLLSYRMPREPSTPRISVWRKLKDLGVAQIGDGLVALPKDARTQEHLEWVAAQVVEAHGEAIVWTASPTARRDSKTLVAQLQAARDVEYEALIEEISRSTGIGERRTIARWRRQLRRIDRRDYFGAPMRDTARLAVSEATESTSPTGVRS